MKNKCIKNKIIFTRADKGKTVIAMKKQESLDKTREFFGSFEVSTTNPTNIHQNEIKQVIKNCSFFNDWDRKSLVVMNPQPPKLYSLIKLHKIDRRIRPIVSFTTAPSVKLSKKLIPIIKFHSNFQPEFSLKIV